MARAKGVLKTLPGIDRPAIAAFFPTRRGESVLLDLGANVDCRPEQLLSFAVSPTKQELTHINSCSNRLPCCKS